jgi:hypothetical protein
VGFCQPFFSKRVVGVTYFCAKTTFFDGQNGTFGAFFSAIRPLHAFSPRFGAF